MSPKPWSAGPASWMLLASACSTVPWPAMIFVYAPSASSGLIFLAVTEERSGLGGRDRALVAVEVGGVRLGQVDHRRPALGLQHVDEVGQRLGGGLDQARRAVQVQPVGDGCVGHVPEQAEHR